MSALGTTIIIFVVLIFLFLIFGGTWIGLCKYNSDTYFCKDPFKKSNVNKVKGIKVELFTSPKGSGYVISWEAATGNGDPTQLFYNWSVWKGKSMTGNADDTGTTQATNFILNSKFYDEEYITVGIIAQYGNYSGDDWKSAMSSQVLSLGIPPKIKSIQFTPPTNTSDCSGLSYQVNIDPSSIKEGESAPLLTSNLYISPFNYSTGVNGPYFPISSTPSECSFKNNTFTCSLNVSSGICVKSFYGNNKYQVNATVCDPNNNTLCNNAVGASGIITPQDPVLSGKINLLVN